MESSAVSPPPAEQPTRSAEKPLSKNALKKIAKAEKFAALKQERRAREKEAKKEKKRERAEKRAAGELDSEDDEDKKRQLKKRKVQFGGHIVVDLGFDDMMNEKVSAIMYAFS
jgi:tRNA (guanine9-N1)-methyltransferase